MKNKRPISANSPHTRRVSRGRHSWFRSYRRRCVCGTFFLRCSSQNMTDTNTLLRLQVLQYKKRCGDLEHTLQETSSELEKHRVSGV